MVRVDVDPRQLLLELALRVAVARRGAPEEQAKLGRLKRWANKACRAWQRLRVDEMCTPVRELAQRDVQAVLAGVLADDTPVAGRRVAREDLPLLLGFVMGRRAVDGEVRGWWAERA